MRVLIDVLIILGDILLQSRRTLHPLHVLLLTGSLLLLMNIVLHLHLSLLVELLSLVLLCQLIVHYYLYIFDVLLGAVCVGRSPVLRLNCAFI